MPAGTLAIVKHDHACIELQHEGQRIVVDPGTIGAVPSLEGCAAVLVSHAHFDHASVELLEQAAASDVPVHGPSDLPRLLDSELLRRTLQVRAPGDRMRVAGLDIEVLGGRHARVHPEVEGPENLAFLVDDRVLITGDEHPDVERPVDTLVTPVDAPWLRAVDLIEFVRRVRPRLVLGVHDGLVNEHGAQVADAVLSSLTREGAGAAHRLAVGERLELQRTH